MSLCVVLNDDEKIEEDKHINENKITLSDLKIMKKFLILSKD